MRTRGPSFDANLYPRITQITQIQRETERNKNVQPLKLQTQLFTSCCLNLRNLRIKIYTLELFIAERFDRIQGSGFTRGVVTKENPDGRGKDY
jgi:hypothetical protein